MGERGPQKGGAHREGDLAHRRDGNRRIRPSILRVSAAEDFGLFLFATLAVIVVFIVVVS